MAELLISGLHSNTNGNKNRACQEARLRESTSLVFVCKQRFLNTVIPQKGNIN